MSHPAYLTPDLLHRALTLPDLTDPSQGPHAIQLLLDDVVGALSARWEGTTRWVRSSPLVPVRDNYDRLGYASGDVTRARRYTRYVSGTVMLRSHMSAVMPAALEGYRDEMSAVEVAGADDEAAAVDLPGEVDELIIAPGPVYRRDVVDRSHVGEPHQVDLWRLRCAPTTDADMLEMIDLLVGAVLPGAEWRTTDVTHPYTIGGRQIDVLHDRSWLELAECGRIHPDVLRGSGLDPERWSGLALGMGLERALMLRKGFPDIRCLRATDPRIARQMQTLELWQEVSSLPAARRDVSVVVAETEDEETLGDRVRGALGDDAEVIESLEVLGRTAHEDLPAAARERLGTCAGQVNLLLRIILRPLDRTLTAEQANDLRNRIYTAVHEGPVAELI